MYILVRRFLISGFHPFERVYLSLVCVYEENIVEKYQDDEQTGM